jgi:O-antigen/teichoic acid export membrane protein
VADDAGAPADVAMLESRTAGGAAIRGAGLRVASYGAGVLLSVGSAALLFRHLGTDDAGRYVTVLSLVTIVAGLTDAGLTTIGLREVATSDGAEQRRFLSNLLGLRLVLTTAGVAGATLFSLAAGYRSAMVAGTALVGAALIVQNLQQTLSITLMSELRLGWVALAELIRQIIVVVGIVALVAAGAGLLPFYATSIPAATATLVLTVGVVRGSVPLAPRFDWSAWRTVLRETLPFAAATAVSAIYFRLAIVLMSLIAAARETGYFSASFRIIEVLVAVTPLVVGSAFPILAHAARSDHDRLAYGTTRLWEASTAFGAGLAVMLFAGAPFVIEVVAGPDFGPAVPVLRIQAIGLAASFAAAPWAYALLALRMHREVLLTALLALTSTAVLTPVLVPSLGAEGGALATTITEALLAVTLPVALIRRYPAMRPSLRTLPRIGVAAVAAGALAFVPSVPSVVLLVASGVVFLALALALRAIPHELIEQALALRERLPR